MSNPCNWTPEDVGGQLKQIGLGKYASKFISNGISGEKLYLLKDLQMRDLGLPVSTRVTLANWIKSLPPPQKKSSSRLSKPARPALGRSAVPVPEPAPTVRSRQSTATKSRPSATAVHHSDHTVKPRTSARPAPSRDTSISKTRFAQQAKPAAKRISHGVEKRAPMPMEMPVDDSPDDRVPCSYCHRRFAPDRIGKHEESCAVMSKKRRVFNSRKQRLQGTEAAQFQRAASKTPAAKPKKTINGKPKYVVEHENLVKALRAARRFTAYEEAAAKGRAKGPPPAIPIMQDLPDDRVKCKYCKRKFGQEQYERHLPGCRSRNAPIPSVKKTVKGARPRRL